MVDENSFEYDALEIWEHAGLRCMIRFGMRGLNGYVQLPAENVERQLAEAWDLAERPVRVEQTRALFEGMGLPVPTLRDDGPSQGYFYLSEQVVVSGGLTWGPTNDGWVGFDTSHGGDVWDFGELEEVLATHVAGDQHKREWYLAILASFRDLEAGDDDFSRSRYAHHWTYALVKAETEQLAKQFADLQAAHEMAHEPASKHTRSNDGEQPSTPEPVAETPPSSQSSR